MTILTFDWLMESIQIFLRLETDWTVCSKLKETILFILNSDSWQKIIKIDLLAILDFDAAT